MPTSDPTGGRPPTLEDVARAAGVSRALVSIVVRDAPGASAATRERVRQVAAELGYRPDRRARLLAGSRTQLLGVALSLNNPFHTDVTEAIYRFAAAADLQVILSAVTDDRPAGAALEALLDYRCEAGILLAPPARYELERAATRVPLTVVGQTSRAAGVDVVRAADDRGVRLAVEHLAGLGHRRISYVDGGHAPAAAARRTGYRRAMTRLGLAEQITVIPGGPRETDGAVVAEQMDERGWPEAIITYNDRCAVGLLDTCVRLGINVPADVSVVGYDDSQVARLPYLQLTTVSQDADQLARAAVQRAVDRIGSNPSVGTERAIVLEPRLVVRATTSARARQSSD